MTKHEKWFHTDCFITEYLFSARVSSFKSRHAKLSIDIFLLSVCKVFDPRGLSFQGKNRFVNFLIFKCIF